MFFIQAKVAPNIWIPIDELSSELAEFQFGYPSIIEASKAKGKIKNYLKAYDPKNKVPIRIIKME